MPASARSRSHAILCSSSCPVESEMAKEEKKRILLLLFFLSSSLRIGQINLPSFHQLRRRRRRPRPCCWPRRFGSAARVRSEARHQFTAPLLQWRKCPKAIHATWPENEGRAPQAVGRRGEVKDGRDGRRSICRPCRRASAFENCSICRRSRFLRKVIRLVSASESSSRRDEGRQQKEGRRDGLDCSEKGASHLAFLGVF